MVRPRQPTSVAFRALKEARGVNRCQSSDNTAPGAADLLQHSQRTRWITEQQVAKDGALKRFIIKALLKYGWSQPNQQAQFETALGADLAKEPEMDHEGGTDPFVRGGYQATRSPSVLGDFHTYSAPVAGFEQVFRQPGCNATRGR